MLASTLPPERLTNLQALVEALLAIWAGSPASYVIVVGRRRDTAIAD